jgi:hypothetical protein
MLYDEMQDGSLCSFSLQVSVASSLVLEALTLACIARIAGGALIVAGELTKNPSPDLFIAAYIMFHAGLAVLMLSTIGFLGLACVINLVVEVLTRSRPSQRAAHVQ